MSTDQPAGNTGSNKGPQDVVGWGLLGMTVGTVGGFLIVYYGIIPMFPKEDSTLLLTIMTSIAVAAMTLGGAVGYLATRRKSH